MKRRNAFTLIELLISIFIVILVAISAGLLIYAGIENVRKNQAKQAHAQQVASAEKINVGDTVYVDGMDITGRVNRIFESRFKDSNTADLLVKGTNGTPTVIGNINVALLRKIVNLESPSDRWRNSR